MATELYDLGVPPFIRGLRALDGLLDKALAHAAGTGQNAEAWLDARLACDSPKLCVARLSGVTAPVHDDSEITIAELRGRIAKTLDYIASVPREAIDGQEGREVVVTFPGGQMTFEGRPYLTGFALPNFYFHLTTAYGLLRQAGVPLAKRDFMGAPN